MGLLEKGEAEVSLFWKMMGVNCKIRTDWLYLCPIKEEGESFILDLKSTTGNTKNAHSIKGKISSYSYDLSTAFYIDLFNTYMVESGLDKKYKLISKFYWTFASKDLANCKTYVASPKMLQVGRIKYQKALHTIKTYKDLDWEFVDFVEELDPAGFEDEWLSVDPTGLDLPKSSRFAKSETLKQSSGEELL